MEIESCFRNESKLNASTAGVTVQFEAHCWQKINGWCKAASSEVSGVGLVKSENGVLTVYDVYLPKQKCSSAYTELDEESVARLSYKLSKKNKNLADMRLWWHTHYNFGVFWSGTDDDTARTMVKGNGDWLLSVVINQAGDYRCRVDTVRPIPVTIDELSVSVVSNSRYRKRKRGFKRDIAKYVSGYGEVNTAVATSDFPYSWNAPRSRWGYNRMDDWQGESYQSYGYGYGEWQGYSDTPVRTKEIPERTYSPQSEKLVPVFNSVWKWHDGKLIRRAEYDAIMRAKKGAIWPTEDIKTKAA